MSKKPSNYVNNKTLHNELVKWYNSGSNTGEIPSVIVEAVMQICDRLGMKNNFRGYTYLSEMQGSALLSCVVALKEKKYDPTKSENPFAYFTQIAYNEFIRVINEEKKHSYIKHKSLEHHMTSAMLAGEMVEAPADDAGRAADLVEKFESKKNEKRTPSANPDSGDGEDSEE